MQWALSHYFLPRLDVSSHAQSHTNLTEAFFFLPYFPQEVRLFFGRSEIVAEVVTLQTGKTVRVPLRYAAPRLDRGVATTTADLGDSDDSDDEGDSGDEADGMAAGVGRMGLNGGASDSHSRASSHGRSAGAGGPSWQAIDPASVRPASAGRGGLGRGAASAAVGYGRGAAAAAAAGRALNGTPGTAQPQWQEITPGATRGRGRGRGRGGY